VAALVESAAASGANHEIQAKLTFDFTTPSPQILRPLPAGSTFSRVTLFITSPFLGGSPEIQLGDAINPSLFFDLKGSDLGMPHQYDFDELVTVDPSDNLILTLSSGLTAGSAILFYEGFQ